MHTHIVHKKYRSCTICVCAIFNWLNIHIYLGTTFAMSARRRHENANWTHIYTKGYTFERTYYKSLELFLASLHLEARFIFFCLPFVPSSGNKLVTWKPTDIVHCTVQYSALPIHISYVLVYTRTLIALAYLLEKDCLLLTLRSIRVYVDNSMLKLVLM